MQVRDALGLAVMHVRECRYSGMAIEDTWRIHHGVQPDDCCCTKRWPREEDVEIGIPKRESELITCGTCGAEVFNAEFHAEWHAKHDFLKTSLEVRGTVRKPQGMTHARLQEIRTVVSWDSSPETITMRKWQVMEYLRECMEEIERCWREEI